MANEIPIRNIYYILTYAYDILNQGENIKLASENFNSAYDLFGKIIVNGLNHLIKRGFFREYITNEDELTVLRGKLNIGETLKTQSHIKGKLHVEYDELSSDILFNQIIKTTINTLIRYKALDKEIKTQLIKVNRYFQNIRMLGLQKQHFSMVKFNRNNAYYKMLLDISELIFDLLIVSNEKGETLFKDFIRDNKMATLYEKFILNYYKKEAKKFKVYSPHIKWNLDSDFEHVGEKFLPIMRTDIVLENQEKQIIIDAKYYVKALKTRNVGETKKLISSNLYQIYTYINNTTFENEVIGMLMYPVVDTEIDFEYSIGGKRILIRTLNLDADWNEICKRLNGVIGV